VPSLTASVVPSTYANLLSSLPSVPEKLKSSPRQFDWALHPGGSSILTGVEKAMGISAEHMRASYDVYMNHGNSSSATIISVLDRLRSKEMDQYCPADEPVDGGEGNERKGGPGKPKEYVVGCAFGPGITVEMCMFRRNLGFTGRNRVPLEGQSGLGNGTNGLVTPPETESEGSRSEGEEERLVEAMGRVELD
jgi:type III polyketide synthase